MQGWVKTFGRALNVPSQLMDIMELMITHVAWCQLATCAPSCCSQLNEGPMGSHCVMITERWLAQDSR